MRTQFQSMPDGIKKIQVNINSTGAYPFYPVVDHIYYKYHKEKVIYGEEISKVKEPNEYEKIRIIREKYLLDEMCGNYLDDE